MIKPVIKLVMLLVIKLNFVTKSVVKLVIIKLRNHIYEIIPVRMSQRAIIV